jgi:hypothetical protein
MMHFQAEVVNNIVETQWQMKQASNMRISVMEEFRKMCRLEVPAKYKEDYRQLLTKHWHIFSLNKNDIGYCSMILHKLFMRTNEPFYMKQFKIPEAHQHYLQDQV